jgi:hypothetical protein
LCRISFERCTDHDPSFTEIGSCFFVDFTKLSHNGTITGLQLPAQYNNSITYGGLIPNSPVTWGDNFGYCAGFASAPAFLYVISDTSTYLQKSGLTLSPILMVDIRDLFGNPYVVPVSNIRYDFAFSVFNNDNQGSVTGLSTSNAKFDSSNVTFPSLTVTAQTGSTTKYRVIASYVIPGTTTTRSIRTNFTIAIQPCLIGEQPTAAGKLTNSPVALPHTKTSK